MRENGCWNKLLTFVVKAIITVLFCLGLKSLSSIVSVIKFLDIFYHMVHYFLVRQDGAGSLKEIQDKISSPELVSLAFTTKLQKFHLECKR